MPIQVVRIYVALVMMLIGLQLAGDKEEPIIVLRVLFSVLLLLMSGIILGNF